jgi:hypothetical protein
MNNEQFDKLIKQRLEELEFDANDMQWAKLQQSLQQTSSAPKQVGDDENGGAIILPWWKTKVMLRVAAVLVPLITIGIATALLNKSNNTIGNNSVAFNEPTPAKNNSAAPSTTNTTTENMASNANTDVASQQVVANNQSNTNNYVSVTNVNGNAASTIPASRQGDVANKNNSNAFAQKDASSNQVTTSNKPAVVTTQQNLVNPNTNNQNIAGLPNAKSNVNDTKANQTLPKSNNEVANGSVVMKQQDNVQKQIQMPLMPAPAVRSRGEQTARNYLLAVTTGTGVGRKNQSVAQLGFVAEKPLARKLYIESGINVAHNNLGTIAALTPAQETGGASSVAMETFNAADQPKDLANTSLVGTTNLSSRTGSFTSDDEVALAIAKVTPRYSIEVVPTVGYNVSKRFRVAAGADISRAVFSNETKDEVSYLQRNASHEVAVRNWDAGFNGKVEVNVTRRIALGYRYRAGITKVTPGSEVNSRRNFSNVSLRVRIK